MPENAWKAENGNLCYIIEDDNQLCFYNSSGPQTFGPGLGNPVTESGGNYIEGNITFIMSGDKPERIEVNGDGNFDGVYTPPQNNEDGVFSFTGFDDTVWDNGLISGD